MGAIFRLDRPVLGQTHGRLKERTQAFYQAEDVEACACHAKIVYEIGKVVADDFIPAEEIPGYEVVRQLSAVELEDIYDYAETEGQPEGQRGQLRDSDFGAWISGGNGV